MPISENQAMDMKFRRSSKYITLCAKLFSPSNSNHFHLYCIYCVVPLVGKIDNHFVKAIIRSSIQYDSLVG